MSSAGLVGGQNPSMGKGEPNNPEFERPYCLFSLHQCCRPLKIEKDLGFSKRDSAVRISAQRPTHAETIFNPLLPKSSPESKMVPHCVAMEATKGLQLSFQVLQFRII